MPFAGAYKIRVRAASHHPSHIALLEDLLLLRRLFVGNAHRAECVGAVRGPVVFRPKPDVARLIVLLMVPAQGIEAG